MLMVPDDCVCWEVLVMSVSPVGTKLGTSGKGCVLPSLPPPSVLFVGTQANREANNHVSHVLQCAPRPHAFHAFAFS